MVETVRSHQAELAALRTRVGHVILAEKRFFGLYVEADGAEGMFFDSHGRDASGRAVGVEGGTAAEAAECSATLLGSFPALLAAFGATTFVAPEDVGCCAVFSVARVGDAPGDRARTEQEPSDSGQANASARPTLSSSPTVSGVSPSGEIVGRALALLWSRLGDFLDARGVGSCVVLNRAC